MNKIYKLILDSIIDRYDPISKDEWIFNLEQWKLHFKDGDGEYVDHMIEAIKCEDWECFKKGLIKYMEDQGHKNEPYYSKLCGLSQEYIAGCFKFRLLFWGCCGDYFIHETYEDTHLDDEYDLYDDEKAYLCINSHYEDLMGDDDDPTVKIEFWIENQDGSIVLSKTMSK